MGNSIGMFANLKGNLPEKWEIPSPEYIRQFHRANPDSGILVEIKYGIINFTNTKNSKQDREVRMMFKKIRMSGHPHLPNATFILSDGDSDYYNWRNTIKNGLWLNSSSFLNDPSSKIKPILHPLWYFVTKAHQNQIINFVDWRDKMDKIIWRGSTTGKNINKMEQGPNRKFLVEFSKRFPHLIDANFVNFCDGGIELNKIYDRVEKLTPEEQQKYKYIVNIDGHGASYGLYWQLKSSSHVIRWSTYQQWFEPYVKGVMTEVKYPEELLPTIRKLDSESSKRKAGVAKRVANRIFNDEFVFKYLYELLKEYSKQQSRNNN